MQDGDRRHGGTDGSLRHRAGRWSCAAAATILASLASGAALAEQAPAAARGGLTVTVTGLPTHERPAIVVHGLGVSKTLHARATRLRHLRPGRYVISARAVRLHRRSHTARKGARAFPTRRRQIVRVRRHGRARVVVRYGAIVNPGVVRAPDGVVSVIGDPADPTAVVYRAGTRLPSRGTIMTAAPSPILPAGLMARVTGRAQVNGNPSVRLVAVPVSTAVPAFDYSGALALTASRTARTSTRARASRSCNGPKDFDLGAKLDEFTVRRASSKRWPPQMSFTLAVRTTEYFGARALAAGVSCSWAGGALGPWYGAIPTPAGIMIPVYATIPLTFNASVEGSLSAFRLNLASTSVLSLDLGQHNDASFTQEGSNVWVDGVMRASGKAKLGATLNLVLGVGNPRIADLHVQAGFGPSASWKTGVGCDVDLALGALSAGVKIGPFKKDTPPWSPFSIKLWHGCQDIAAGGGGTDTNDGGGGGTTPTPTPTPQPTPQPVPQRWPEQQGSRGANTFTNPFNASGVGVRIEPYQWVDVSCKVYAPQITSANPDGYWYRIASAPWNDQYYAVANTFWNGDIPGQTPYTHNTDWAVRDC
jgi:hypothetical protein